MRKIILSRKGFDSASGGYPSPILPDGTMISFPIPEDSAGIYYNALKHKDLPYLDLMKQLGIKKYTENSRVHLDPDINYSVIERNCNKWEAIFGQCSASASHLDNHKVKEGDIFLFFGWFRNTIKTASGYKYDPNDKEGRHIIWGYLEIGQKIKIVDKVYPEHYLTHPHFEDKNRPNNTAYIATDKLSLDNSLAGAGVFKYDENLVLSSEPSKKTVWKLPKYFHPDCNTIMTYHTDIKRWENKNDYCLLRCVDRGQEFVIYEKPEIEQWAKDIILRNV